MTNLKDIISKNFYKAHILIKEHKYLNYIFKGGRLSGKSSFIPIEIIFNMMKDAEIDKHTHCVAIRKVKDTLQDSVYNNFLWAIDLLGVQQLWKATKSPLKIVYLPTGQEIKFRGCDDPTKIKSLKFKKGYPKYIWFEEFDEFFGMEEIRSIKQSLLRGGESFLTFFSVNPPRNPRHWCNKELSKNDSDTFKHHSTYLEMPPEWIGEVSIKEAEKLKISDFKSYQHEYLGIAIGDAGKVFQNIIQRTISNLEIQQFENISRGIDWGFANDPCHYCVNNFDSKRNKLYIFHEIQQIQLSNYKFSEMIKKENIKNEIIYCDSAEPKSISEMRDYRLKVVGAKKGADSVEYGVKWLQSLDEIIIDASRCFKTFEEFMLYEYMKDKSGNVISRYVDKDNHSIDAVRYSREFESTRKKIKFGNFN